MRSLISRMLCFLLLLQTFQAVCGGGAWGASASAAASGSSSVTNSAYEPVTIFNKDFSQAVIGQTASQLGFDYSSYTAGTATAVIEADPVTPEANALHLTVSGLASALNNEFQISKSFSEPQTGTISTELTFMQYGTAKQKDRILQFVPSTGTINLIGVGADKSKDGIVYYATTAPSSSLASYTLNQWHTLRVDFNTINQKYDIYLDGTLYWARQKLNNVTKYDLKKLVIATPQENGDLYIRGVKVTRTPFNPKPVPPEIVSITGRNAKIAWWSKSYVYATKYRMRIREKGQSAWLMQSATVNYKDLANKTNIVPASDISSYYDPAQNKSVALTNGKTYILGLSVAIRDEAGLYTSGVPQDYESDSAEVEVTPNTTTPIDAPDASVFGGVTAFANYNAYQWSVNSGLNAGDLVFADKTILFTYIPAKYAGMDWLRTSQADTMIYPLTAEGAVQPQIAQFRVRDRASVYVAVDEQETPPPSWLSDWTDTGDTIKMGDKATAYSFKVYKKDFASGDKVTLGYNNYNDYKAGKNAGYFVMAQRIPTGLTIDPVQEWVPSPLYSVTGSVAENVYASSVILNVYQNQNPVPVYSGQLADNRFKIDLNLLPGANLIEMYAMRSDSAFVDKAAVTIHYDNVPPEIRIAALPAAVKDAVYTLQGSLSKAANLTVKLNGATIVDSIAKAVYEPFAYPLTLAEGSNSIEVSSVDIAGNTASANYLVRYEFWAGQAAAYDFGGNRHDSIAAAANIFAQRQVTNTTASAKQITLWFVLYDGNRTMLDYSSAAADFEPGETKTLSAGFTLPAQVSGCYVKAFIWDSLNGMKPLSDEFVLQ